MGNRVEEIRSLLNGHIENVGNILALVAHIQSLLVEAVTMTDIALNENIRQEVHLDCDCSSPLTVLAATALHIEAESA